MCEFKSGVAVRISENEIVVRVLDGQDSHTEIREAFKIRDTGSALDRFHTPLELRPVKSFDLTDCKLVFDAGQPEWWTPAMTVQARRQLHAALVADLKATDRKAEFIVPQFVGDLVRAMRRGNPASN